jgi:phosphoglycerate dehydrogenase-like enzyme
MNIVVVEATGNVAAVAAVICPYVKQVVIANPKQVRIIAHAKIKTDTLDVKAFERRRQLTRLRAHLVASQRRQSAPRPAFASPWMRTSPRRGETSHWR